MGVIVIVVYRQLDPKLVSVGVEVEQAFYRMAIEKNEELISKNVTTTQQFLDVLFENKIISQVSMYNVCNYLFFNFFLL